MWLIEQATVARCEYASRGGSGENPLSTALLASLRWTLPADFKRAGELVAHGHDVCNLAVARTILRRLNALLQPSGI